MAGLFRGEDRGSYRHSPVGGIDASRAEGRGDVGEDVEGFGELCRRFEARGATEYSPELADLVVREVRADFERGEFSSWKWTAVRRGAALLDVFDRTGSVDIAPLPPWNVWRLPPTPGQLAEHGNRHTLVWTAQQRLREVGLNAKPSQHCSYDGFDPVVRAHQDDG